MIEVILNATVKSNNLTKTRAVRLRADIASTNIGDVAPTTTWNIIINYRVTKNPNI